MEARRIEVTRYYAFDGTEFEDEDVCKAHEREMRAALDGDIHASRVLIRATRENLNRYRLEFRLALCDAHEALEAGDKAGFHEKMLSYYRNKDTYNKLTYDLRRERRRLRYLIDNSYKHFGDRRKKSSEAKEVRRRKSLHWRRENPLDKWVSPRRKEEGQ